MLEQAIGVYEGVLVLGFTPEGNMSVRLSENMNNAKDLLWMLEVFKTELMVSAFNAVDEEE